jgi:hypothetical protein
MREIVSMYGDSKSWLCVPKISIRPQEERKDQEHSRELKNGIEKGKAYINLISYLFAAREMKD